MHLKQVVVEGQGTKNTHKIVIHLQTAVQMVEKKQKRNADSDQRHRCKEQTWTQLGER